MTCTAQWCFVLTGKVCRRTRTEYSSTRQTYAILKNGQPEVCRHPRTAWCIQKIKAIVKRINKCLEKCRNSDLRLDSQALQYGHRNRSKWRGVKLSQSQLQNQVLRVKSLQCWSLSKRIRLWQRLRLGLKIRLNIILRVILKV